MQSQFIAMHVRSLARLSTWFLIGALIALGVARYYVTEYVQSAIESCDTRRPLKPYDALIYGSLNVLQNRTSWLVYFLTMAIIVLSLLVGFIIVTRFAKSRHNKHYIDKDVAPYWFKTTRMIAVMFTMYFLFSAITIVVFVPYEYLYSSVRLDAMFTCSLTVKEMHDKVTYVGEALTAALILGGLASVWGFVWSLESVAQFTMRTTLEPK